MTRSNPKPAEDLHRQLAKVGYAAFAQARKEAHNENVPAFDALPGYYAIAWDRAAAAIVRSIPRPGSIKPTESVHVVDTE